MVFLSVGLCVDCIEISVLASFVAFCVCLCVVLSVTFSVGLFVGFSVGLSVDFSVGLFVDTITLVVVFVDRFGAVFLAAVVGSGAVCVCDKMAAPIEKTGLKCHELLRKT